MKTQVYSWRVSPELKSQIKNSASEIADGEEQRSLHEAAEECVGVLSGSHTERSENVRRDIRERLSKRRKR